MTDAVSFTISGEPVAKGRARMTRSGFAYTPAATRKYEAHARMAAQDAMAGREPFAGPVVVIVHAVFPIPASWSKAKQARADRQPVTKRPDLDNIVKAIFDAANGIVFADDAQIYLMTASKVYGRTPRINVQVSQQ